MLFRSSAFAASVAVEHAPAASAIAFVAKNVRRRTSRASAPPAPSSLRAVVDVASSPRTSPSASQRKISPTRMLLVTCGAQAPTPRATAIGAAQGGWWGLGRVLRLEQPALRVASADVAGGDGSALLAVASGAGDEMEVAWAGGAPHGSGR